MENNKIENEEKINYHTPVLEKYYTVRSLCNWDLYFKIPDGAEKTIKAKGTLDLIGREIKLLCDNNDIFFVGTDSKGSHARILVQDDNMRIYLGFESEDGKRKQNIISDEKCEKLFEYKTQSTFEKNVQENIITEHEKDYIMTYARKNKINDFEKVHFLETYTNRKYKV